MADFSAYYRQQYQQDLLSFAAQIPIEGNKHYNKNEPTIQYFFLTPQYNYLEIIPADRQALFAVALFWTVLIDEVCYSNYKALYPAFRQKTLYPKFIGNCTAPSLMSSECGHHLHPKKILQAINDFKDTGNREGFGREIFQKNESQVKRQPIRFDMVIEQSIPVIESEVKDFFRTFTTSGDLFTRGQLYINGSEFWDKCLGEL